MNDSERLTKDTEALQAMVQAQQSLIAQRDAEIEHLKLVIAKLRRMQFGQSSEKIDETVGSLEFSLEELEVLRAESAPYTAPETPAGADKPAKRPARKPLPDHLPRESVEHPPAASCCPDCGGALKKLGEDVS